MPDTPKIFHEIQLKCTYHSKRFLLCCFASNAFLENHQSNAIDLSESSVLFRVIGTIQYKMRQETETSTKTIIKVIAFTAMLSQLHDSHGLWCKCLYEWVSYTKAHPKKEMKNCRVNQKFRSVFIKIRATWKQTMFGSRNAKRKIKKKNEQIRDHKRRHHSQPTA